MFLKIIRKVQATEGTLLLENWKAACTSQDMSDFDPLTSQHISHTSLRQGSLPGDTAGTSPYGHQIAMGSAVTSAVIWHQLSTTWCPAALLLVRDEVIFRRWVFWAVDGTSSTPHISGRAVAPRGHTVGQYGPTSGPGRQHTPTGLYGSAGIPHGVPFLSQKLLPAGMSPFSGYKARDGQSHCKDSALTGDLELGLSFTSCGCDFMVRSVWWQSRGGELQPP